MAVNIGAFLTRRALLEPNKIALISGDRRLTYRELEEAADRLARAMIARGIGQGDRVAVLLRNTVEYYEIYFGLAKIGGIMCGINWRLARPEVAYILSDCGARLFIYDVEFDQRVAGIEAEVPTLKEEIVVGASPGDARVTYPDLVAAPDEEEPAHRHTSSGEDEPLILMYTSGTTGHPKGALLTHRQMFWCSATIIYTLDHRHDDINLLPLPMYHIGGMSFVTVFVHLGSTVVLIREWESERALALIEREKINHFMAVPAMLTGLLQSPALASRDLSSLRWLLASAAPVPAELIKAFHARGILVLQSYGLTETAGPASVISPDRAIDKAGSAGLPFFHTEMRVINKNGHDVAQGEIGEILIRGPHIIDGYWQNEEANRTSFENGWFRSGDLAYQDEEGYLFIVDRKKDMIISGGENIYPAELERLLYAHPKLAEAAVIGLPDSKWGEMVCAVVVPLDGVTTVTLEELREYCEAHLARYKLPKKLIVRNMGLPRNPTGKLLKNTLREEAQQEVLISNDKHVFRPTDRPGKKK